MWCVSQWQLRHWLIICWRKFALRRWTSVMPAHRPVCTPHHQLQRSEMRLWKKWLSLHAVSSSRQPSLTFSQFLTLRIELQQLVNLIINIKLIIILSFIYSCKLCGVCVLVPVGVFLLGSLVCSHNSKTYRSGYFVDDLFIMYYASRPVTAGNMHTNGFPKEEL